MTQGATKARARATRIAKWLLEKGRPDEAVALLSAWAVGGANDDEGQKLLAEAFRVQPGSAVARMAFERMEGVEGDHRLLDTAVTKYDLAELERLEREVSRPSFLRAQVGFNNNLKYRGHPYHVQTEDSGLDKPHIITHLFAGGGRILKSHKRSYADSVGRPDVAAYVRELMKGQQMEMMAALREGRFDGIIAGRETGGMEVLEHPPGVDVGQVGGKRTEAAAAAVAQSRPQVSGALRFRLHVSRSLSGGPDAYEPRGDDVVIGSRGTVTLLGERFCHSREALLKWRDGSLWLEDFEGGNGAFLRIRRPVELAIGSEFIVGDQLLRIEANPDPNDGPGPGPTYFYPSPKWPSAFRIVQIFQGGAAGACVVARGTSVQIGSAWGDLVLAGDPLVAEQHCVVEEQAGAIVLTDLGSRTGVFVRIQGEQQLAHGDELLFGRTRLIVDLSPSQPR